MRKVLILADTFERTFPYGLRRLEADFDRRRHFFVSLDSFGGSSSLPGRDGAANLKKMLRIQSVRKVLTVDGTEEYLESARILTAPLCRFWNALYQQDSMLIQYCPAS